MATAVSAGNFPHLLIITGAMHIFTTACSFKATLTVGLMILKPDVCNLLNHKYALSLPINVIYWRY
jgi:hypothetical protein